MSEPIFHIKKLFCSYDNKPENAVIFIDELLINKGEIIFLLGSSGSGKSTLLETLGLMNNTIAGGEVVFAPGNGKVVNYSSLWAPGNEKEAADTRKSNFSFIFQNTNLMENFTAYENISLSKMIQEHSTQEAAMDGAKKLMERVGLPPDQVPVDKLSVNLSGGQKQRVTFVRALNSDCTVLFGDEPTGNLDEGNANELMNVVKAYLSERGLTAIIVSHDINLALNHASRIICLTKNFDKGYGEILRENIFVRSQWQGSSAEEQNKLKAKIRTFYTQTGKKTAPAHAPDARVQMSKNYTSLFLRKEGRALAGRGYSNLAILTLLLVCTFLAIGFANGSLSYLKEKIENPFVNWLTIDIPASKGDKLSVAEMIQTISEHKEQFFIKSVSSFSEKPLQFYKADRATIVPTNARSVANIKDPLIQDLIDPRNLVRGSKGFRDDNDLSLIVTRRFMEENGYPADAPFIYFENHEPADSADGPKNRDVYFRVPVGIRAVVKEMPGKAQVAYTNFFDDDYMQAQHNTFDLRHKKDFILYLATTREKAQQQRINIIRLLKAGKWGKDHNFDVQLPQSSPTTYYTAFDIGIAPSPPMHYDEWQKLFEDLAKDLPSDMHPAYYFDYYSNDKDFNNATGSDRLSINFAKLDKVRDFSDFCRETFNQNEEKQKGALMEVDLTSVKEKENFNFLSHITQIVSYILILFGTISVSLFVFNLLKMHLTKVSMNIGTFKAFGLSNAEAQNVYFIIIIRFVVLCIAISLLLSGGIGILLDRLMAHWFVIESGVSYFKLLFTYTYVTLALILVSALLVSWFTIRRMLSKSPGDLIYNR